MLRQTSRSGSSSWKPALLAAAFCTLVGTTRASEKIEGAFGLKLGQVFNPTTPPVKKYALDATYAFTPEKPNPMFSDYRVCINPETHVVYIIIAAGELPDLPACKQWLKVMTAFLHARYGTLPSDEQSVRQEGRSVYVGTTSAKTEKPGCLIEYTDDNLVAAVNQLERDRHQEQLIEEQKRLLQTVDTTGL